MTTSANLDAQFDVVGEIIRFESGEATALETLELFGHLLRSGSIAGLQGSYHRTLAALLDEGLLDPETGNITDLAVERLAELS